MDLELREVGDPVRARLGAGRAGRCRGLGARLFFPGWPAGRQLLLINRKFALPRVDLPRCYKAASRRPCTRCMAPQPRPSWHVRPSSRSGRRLRTGLTARTPTRSPRPAAIVISRSRRTRRTPAHPGRPPGMRPRDRSRYPRALSPTRRCLIKSDPILTLRNDVQQRWSGVSREPADPRGGPSKPSIDPLTSGQTRSDI